MTWARLGVVLGAVAVSAASATPAPGDRQGGDGTDGGGPACPDGEVCSDATPNGLAFGGALWGDDHFNNDGPPKVTAVGGTQTIRLVGIGGLPYEATAPGEFDVVANGDGTVTVTGTSAGSGYLRIVEPGTDLLYDRIQLRVADVASAAVIDGAMSFPTLDEDAPRVYWAGGGHPLVIGLHDDGGGRLVDEGVALGLPAGSTRDAERWDRFTAGAAPAGDRAIPVTLADGTTVSSASLRLVDDVDTLTAAEGYDPELGVTAGGSRAACFHAHDGGVIVRGVPLATYVDGPITVGPVEGQPLLFSGCLTIEGLAVGTAELTVQADAVAASFTVPVRPAAAPPPAPAPADPVATRPAAGERAARVGSLTP